MKKHPYRALLIWGLVIVSLVNIYPTVGWMLLPDDVNWLKLSEKEREETAPTPGTRQARLVKWQKEDDEFARERRGPFSALMFTVKRWAEFDRSRVINLGLDLQGGIHMVIRFDHRELSPDRLQDYENRGYKDDDIQREVQQVVLQQIRRRINDFEAKEPIIQALGTNQIQIQLPGEKNVDRAKKLITKTALLNFHIVAGADETVPVFTKIKDRYPNEFTPFIIRPKMRGEPFKVSAENYERVKRVLDKAAQAGDIIPEGKMIAFSQPPKPYEEQIYELYLLDKAPIASGEGLRSAAAIPDDSNPPYWQILFSFNNAAGARFGEATEKNINRAMAIVLDGVVCSAPVIRDRITTNGQITGRFEGAEAADLAIALNSGSMVVPVHEEFTRVVGASLGADAVRKGVLSSILGIIIVGLFMLVYYLWAGVVALIGLVVNFIMIVAAMAYFNMTLTLPGIAGLILTLGMAVDANVLIYERIREELRLGHALITSVENGFNRAAVTILDANITTLIAAAVLMQFGTGPIEGFAITLSIGVCSSVFAALVVCRAVMDFLLRNKIITKLTMLSLIRPDTKIPFLQMRTFAIAGSLIAIVLGMSVFTWRGTANFGVDFTQGTNLHLTLNNDHPVPVNDVRVALGGVGFTSPIVQVTGDSDTVLESNQFIIRVGDVDQPASDPDAAQAPVVTVADRIQKALAPLTKSGSVEDVKIEDQQTVGPAVGKQLRYDAAKALFWAYMFIVVYLAFRFELKFGVAAIVALVHDVLITLAAFAVLHRQVDMNVVAALLTIVGYSINDTIVVFDRVREDLGVYRGKGYRFIDILNMSINSTLSRTLLTSATTLFVVVVLFFFGGDAINDFAFALLVGIIIGTYSSVFVAGPVVYYWQRFQTRRQQNAESRKGDSKAGSRAKPATT